MFERYADNNALGDFKSAFASIKEGKKIEFWSKVIPFVYGDLLELYGDQLGHKRMGHTHNIQLREIFYKSTNDYAVKGAAVRKKPVATQEEVKAFKTHFASAMSAVQKMDKADAVDLGCKILRGDIYQEYGKAIRVSYRKSSLGRSAVESILSRDDISQRDIILLRSAGRQGPRDDRPLAKLTKAGSGPYPLLMMG